MASCKVCKTELKNFDIGKETIEFRGKYYYCPKCQVIIKIKTVSNRKNKRGREKKRVLLPVDILKGETNFGAIIQMTSSSAD